MSECPTSPTIYPSKFTSEVKIYPVDFTSVLLPGETISTAVSAMHFESGDVLDLTPSAMLSGSASFSGPIVSQLVQGGTAGAGYRLITTITTNLAQTRILEGSIAVNAI